MGSAAKLGILGGAYSAPSFSAGAQRSINLFPADVPERDRQGSVNVVHYDRPGLKYLSSPPVASGGRCLYRSSTAQLFAVCGNSVYYINPDFKFILLGNLITPGNNPCYMADDGQDILLVDGSTQGYDINFTLLGTNVPIAFSQIGNPLFLGADRVGILDSFFVFNQPGTPNFGSSLSNQIQFNALDFGSKTAYPDPISTLCAIHRELWLLGIEKSEVWVNAGLAGFSFQIVPGVIVEHGCAAKNSLATADSFPYWLSQNKEGARMAMKGQDRVAIRISNDAVEAEWKKYGRVDDAVGATHQQWGHNFYKLHFPTADKTWVYDEFTKEWHQRAYCDTNGILHRERDAFNAYCYGKNLGLDWVNGDLYELDPDTYVDQIQGSNAPLVRIRSMPHLVAEGYERNDYQSLSVNMDVGTGAGTTNVPLIGRPWNNAFNQAFGPQVLIEPPLISLRISDTKGASFGDPIMQFLGAAGEYNSNPIWNNLGTARDRVYELSWSTPQKSTLVAVYSNHDRLET